MGRKLAKLAIVFNVLLVLLTVALSLATLLSYFAPIVNPESIWWIAFLGLGGQLLILFNFIFMAYWVARMKWIAILPAIVFICGVGFFGDFYQIKIAKDYVPEQRNDVVTFVSYNVKTFEQNRDSYSEIAELLNNVNADIICFQEFGYISNSVDSSRFEKFYGKYEHRAILADMAILSKYPLHGVKLIRFPSTANNAVKVEVVCDDNTFTLYNVHLQTTEFNQTSGGSVKALVDSENSSDAIKVTGGAMKRNFVMRAFQADSLAQMFESEKFPIILAGDINDTPMSYTYNKLMGDIFEDAYNVAGAGYGYSYRKLMKLFRIDYVMCQSDAFSVVDYTSPNVDYSDHNPIIVKFKFNQNFKE